MSGADNGHDSVFTNIRIKPEIDERLKREAERIGISRQALLNVIIARYFNLMNDQGGDTPSSTHTVAGFVMNDDSSR